MMPFFDPVFWSKLLNYVTSTGLWDSWRLAVYLETRSSSHRRRANSAEDALSPPSGPGTSLVPYPSACRPIRLVRCPPGKWQLPEGSLGRNVLVQCCPVGQKTSAALAFRTRQ